ncbi:MAG: hypothetical protein ABMB14_24285 [Myxococcota bacterium]
MTWRPWIVTALLILALLLDALLLINEQIPSVRHEQEVVDVEEKLRTLQYLPGNRRGNFQTMGMPFEVAEAAASQISRFEKQGERFQKLLEEQGAEVADVFCPSEKLPQPYAALSYLVYEENGTRYVVDPNALRRFDRQPWYDASLVPSLYDQFERTAARKDQATLMAVSAALLGMEEAALDGESPWSLGLLGSWGFSRLEKRQPKVTALAIEYFALMHFLTELANAPDGICS